MSDIVVKKLAEMIKAPVEVLLRQLQDAGIRVSGPDDRITDQQKLMLLDKMSSSTSNTTHLKKGSNKVFIKRKSEQGHQNRPANKVNVEVKRKKSFARQAAENTSVPHVSRTDELTRQLEAERKAREAIIVKAEQERRTLEAKRLAARHEVQEQQKSAPHTQEAKPEVAVVSSDVPPVANTEAVAPTTVVETQVENNVVENLPEMNENVIIAPESTSQTSDNADTEQASVVVAETPNTVVDNDNTAEEKTAHTSTPPSITNDETNPESVAEQRSNMLNLNAREQREAVAAAARQEAASALKRRPSRPKPKPKISLAPKNTIDADDSSDADKAKVTVKEKNNDDDVVRVEKKRGDKKPVRSKGQRERDDVSSNRSGKGRKGRKGQGNHNQQQAEPRIDRDAKHGFEKPTAPVVREVEIPSMIVVSDLAQRMAIRATDVIKAMMKMGMMVTINQSIDQDTAILVTEELGHIGKPMQEVDDQSMLAAALVSTDGAERRIRPPVVTIMGHVDHGKTSLLDYIREARVAAGEAGGITQHIGAYHVDLDHGTVTFLDTPGHSAFTKMRARGAQVTDIVILIVAADDGVMPQTKEAIEHARAANVPMVVVINKMDKPDADPERVLSELSQHGVLTEAWGGDIPVVKVSAKTGEGIDELLETLLLVAEVQELTAATDVPAKGHVIEASVERGRGAVATILVREGTLRKGDILLCGSEYGRVRAMFDERGRSVKEAGPSIPVAVLGLTGAPLAGDEALVVTDERKAREIAELRHEKQRDTRFAEQQTAKLDNIFNQMQSGNTEQRSQLNLIVKADVQGSVEAIRSELMGLATDEIEIRILAAGVGGMTEGDIDLAAASSAIVVAFNVRANAATRKAAMDNNVEIRYYSIIYDVINDVKDAMSGMLSPETREVFIGLAEVKNVFKASDFGQVAGCLVIEGIVKRGNPIRVLRDNVVIYTGELESLRRHRDNVKEVSVGTECGIAVRNYNDVRVGDQIEVFENIEVARKIS